MQPPDSTFGDPFVLEGYIFLFITAFRGCCWVLLLPLFFLIFTISPQFCLPIFSIFIVVHSIFPSNFLSYSSSASESGSFLASRHESLNVSRQHLSFSLDYYNQCLFFEIKLPQCYFSPWICFSFLSVPETFVFVCSFLLFVLFNILFLARNATFTIFFLFLLGYQLFNISGQSDLYFPQSAFNCPLTLIIRTTALFVRAELVN